MKTGKKLIILFFLCAVYAAAAFVLFKYAEPDYVKRPESLIPLGAAALCIVITELFPSSVFPLCFTAAAGLTVSIFFFSASFIFFPAAEIYIMYKNFYCRNRIQKISFYAASGLCLTSAVCFIPGFVRGIAQPPELNSNSEWFFKCVFFAIPLLYLLIFRNSFKVAKNAKKSSQQKTKNDIPEKYHTVFLCCLLFSFLQAIYCTLFAYSGYTEMPFLLWLLFTAALALNGEPFADLLLRHAELA